MALLNNKFNQTPEPPYLQSAILQNLRRRGLAYILFAAGVVVLAYWHLYTYWQPAYAQRWLWAAGGVLLIEAAILWWGLQYNHAPTDERLRPTLGAGNHISLLRGLLLCLLAGFLLAPRPSGLLAWVPALLYTAARLIDFVDGYVARVTNSESKLGALLDIEFDGLGVLVAISLAIHYGQIPLWYFPLGLSRQLFVAGVWLRERQVKPVYELPPSDHRRVIAGFQTGFLTVILWPILSPPTTTLASAMFALPLIASFGRDWLVVSEVWDATDATYLRWRRWLKQLLESWLPLGARMVGTVLAFLLLWREIPSFPLWRGYLLTMGMADPTWLLALFAALFSIGLIGLALGAAGRIGAVMLIGLACFDILATDFQWQNNALLLACAIYVAHFGSGLFSLWRPEEWFLHAQFGASHAHEDAETPS